MRERRWESEKPLAFDAIKILQRRLWGLGLKVRNPDEVVACYIEEFIVNRLDEIERLSQWPIEEMTLVQVQPEWRGDFYLFAAKHHELFRQHEGMEGYVSLSHPWCIPDLQAIKHHEPEALFWVGFRDTHGFIRVRVLPREIITPGERRDEALRGAWLNERAAFFSTAVEVLDLPLEVECTKERLTLRTEGTRTAVSLSWPDAFGPCQFEFVDPDRYALIVPAAQLIAKLGQSPALVKTYLSGFSPEALEAFHQLQPTAQTLYRGYIHACTHDLPDIVQAFAPARGRALINLCEFETDTLLAEGESAAAIVGVIASPEGYQIEVRLNRAPLPENQMQDWLKEVCGQPFVYAPLNVY